jgi:hypothetical protein
MIPLKEELKMPVYQINKGINKPLEFKGLKAQYIGYLGAGLVVLLLVFTVVYLFGLPVYACLALVSLSGCSLFYKVFQLSHRYGEHGLMKRNAKRYLPAYLRFSSRKLFTHLNQSNGKV